MAFSSELNLSLKDVPVGTAINISPGRDVTVLLAADENVDILDSVSLTGVLQDKGIGARVRQTQTELKLRLEARKRQYILYKHI